jgi:hypothetical protein
MSSAKSDFENKNSHDQSEDWGDEENQQALDDSSNIDQALLSSASSSGRKYIAYTVKLPSEQLAALQSIWLELKRLYGAHSPDKSGMIQQAISEWLMKWEGADREELLRELLEIRQDTRKRQYRKS